MTESTASSSRYVRRFSAIAMALVLLTFFSPLGLAAAVAAPQEAHAPAAARAEADHSLTPTIAKIVNFTVLVGLLVYFLRAPITTYLRSRGETVRRELVDAATLRSEAERQLRDVRSQLAALPAELDELRRRGEQELVDERARMKAATEKVRQQLLERMRREIDFQFRHARRELVEHTADLAVNLARRRIERTITSEDQVRLIDKYAAEVHS